MATRIMLEIARWRDRRAERYLRPFIVPGRVRPWERRESPENCLVQSRPGGHL